MICTGIDAGSRTIKVVLIDGKTFTVLGAGRLHGRRRPGADDGRCPEHGARSTGHHRPQPAIDLRPGSRNNGGETYRGNKRSGRCLKYNGEMR